MHSYVRTYVHMYVRMALNESPKKDQGTSYWILNNKPRAHPRAVACNSTWKRTIDEEKLTNSPLDGNDGTSKGRLLTG